MPGFYQWRGKGGKARLIARLGGLLASARSRRYDWGMKYGPPFELVKLNDADVAVIKATITEEFSNLRGTIESMGWSLVKTPPSVPDPP